MCGHELGEKCTLMLKCNFIIKISETRLILGFNETLAEGTSSLLQTEKKVIGSRIKSLRHNREMSFRFNHEDVVGIELDSVFLVAT